MDIKHYVIGDDTVYITPVIETYILAMPDSGELGFVTTPASIPSPTSADVEYKKLKVADIRKVIIRGLRRKMNHYTEKSLMVHVKGRFDNPV